MRTEEAKKIYGFVRNDFGRRYCDKCDKANVRLIYDLLTVIAEKLSHLEESNVDVVCLNLDMNFSEAYNLMEAIANIKLKSNNNNACGVAFINLEAKNDEGYFLYLDLNPFFEDNFEKHKWKVVWED